MDYILPEQEKHKVNIIRIRIKRINQLFNSFDPSPFMEKDLDEDAYEYIISAAKDIHLKKKQKILVHLPKNQKGKFSELDVQQAIHNYFEYKTVLTERDIKLEVQEGQRSFVIGIVFLASCLVASELLYKSYTNLFIKILTEGLIIGGWVAMWKPISNILYDWWPLSQERKLFKKLSTIEIDFEYEE